MKLFKSVPTLAAILLTSLFSAYIFAHIIAKVFLVEIPLIKTVATTMQPKVLLPVKAQEQLDDRDRYGFFGQPVTMRIPRLNYSLNLASAIAKSDGFLTTDQLGFYLPFAKSKSGRLGDTVIFTADQSKIMDIVGLLVENDWIVIETNMHWRYHYKVSYRTTASLSEPFLPSNSTLSRIYLLRPTGDESFLVLEASLRNLEEIAI